MFREMRRSDRQLNLERTHQILKDGEFGVMSVMTHEGYPYGVPLSYAFDGNSIYFHSADKGHKLDSIAVNHEVSFTVVGKTEVLPEKFSTKYESVVTFGKASKIEGDEKIKALGLLIEKYSPEYISQGHDYIERAAGKTAVVKISIEHITGKARD